MAKSKPKTEKTLRRWVPAIRSHATDLYEQDGWDFVVECLDDDDIVEMIREARTLKSAIATMKRFASLKDEQRRAVVNEIF